ncbi:hypothetical protein F5Y04DRAFT_255090 [Hypomontagnella monticulosa]|nr:hypothetical protein F5Y04DRAFT_255090 [Hypomontagnella monticulosa]
MATYEENAHGHRNKRRPSDIQKTPEKIAAVNNYLDPAANKSDKPTTDTSTLTAPKPAMFSHNGTSPGSDEIELEPRPNISLAVYDENSKQPCHHLQSHIHAGATYIGSHDQEASPRSTRPTASDHSYRTESQPSTDNKLGRYVTQQSISRNHAREVWLSESKLVGPLRLIPELTGARPLPALPKFTRTEPIPSDPGYLDPQSC